MVLSSCQNLPSVVLYTSVDEPFAAPIVRQFERQQGVRVRLVTDTEATKSIGLAERLRAERSSPRCDVWWGNEPFNTALLAEEGLLVARPADQLASTPEAFRDPQGLWAGNGLRYRVLALSPDLVDEPVHGRPITGLSDMLRPELKGKIALARPVAGTTMGHVAVMYVEWGPQKFADFFRRLHANGAVVLGGNGEVVKQVGAGNITLGLTDNDDVHSMTREGVSVAQIRPDQNPQVEGAAAEFALPGTVAIPTTVGLVVGRPANARARLLADFLLSVEVEDQLIAAGFAAGSVRDPSAPSGKPVRIVSVDYLNTAHAMPAAARLAADLLDGKEPAPSAPN